jgi:hypothetical protein
MWHPALQDTMSEGGRRLLVKALYLHNQVAFKVLSDHQKQNQCRTLATMSSIAKSKM